MGAWGELFRTVRDFIDNDFRRRHVSRKSDWLWVLVLVVIVVVIAFLAG